MEQGLNNETAGKAGLEDINVTRAHSINERSDNRERQIVCTCAYIHHTYVYICISYSLVPSSKFPKEGF